MIYMLDTNIVSLAIRNDAEVIEQLQKLETQNTCISVITAAEIRYGLAKRGFPTGLMARVNAFMERVSVYPWNSDVALQYGSFRAECEKKGAMLATLDMMIAAHAYMFQVNNNNMILVTRDKAFHFVASKIPALKVDMW